MLEFKSVTKKFGEIEALSDVSFDIDDKEFVFITGPSGAGKTTLLRLIIRQYLPTSGNIFFDNVEINKIKKREVPLLRQQIGSVFQDYRLLPERTIYENVEIGLLIKKIFKEDRDERVKSVLEVVGLKDRMDLFPSQLSGGELQRATLARALVMDPKLIFADEPTGNLDEETAKGIIELLLAINSEGKTVVVSTHNKDLVDKIKKREIRLDHGKVTHDSHPKKNKKVRKEDPASPTNTQGHEEDEPHKD
jgi:cell division transport system ATP-binding protein